MVSNQVKRPIARTYGKIFIDAFEKRKRRLGDGEFPGQKKQCWSKLKLAWLGEIIWGENLGAISRDISLLCQASSSLCVEHIILFFIKIQTIFFPTSLFYLRSFQKYLFLETGDISLGL